MNWIKPDVPGIHRPKLYTNCCAHSFCIVSSNR